VYQGAPAPVAGYLATVAKGAMLAVLVRYLLAADALAGDAALQVLAVVAVLSMIVGNLLALLQQHIKRVLAYSAIAHFGYLLVPLVAVGRTDAPLALEATLVYLTAYVVMSLGAFGVVAVMTGRHVDGEADSLDAYAGLFWRNPGLAAILTVVLLSLAGIPLTVGFIAKFYLFAAGVSAMAWVLVGALVVGSGIGLYYYLRIVYTMTRSDAAGHGAVAATPLGGWTLSALGVLLLGFGIYPMPLIQVVRQALANWGG
jgi:NADH-quinone oxidoreductase subunit N